MVDYVVENANSMYRVLEVLFCLLFGIRAVHSRTKEDLLWVG